MKMFHRLFCLLAVLLLSVGFSAAMAGPLDALFAPKEEPWGQWEAFDPDSKTRVKHLPWARFLASYVELGPDGINRLAYHKVTEADRATLENYLAALGKTSVKVLNRNEQLAYWINFYNALTAKVVLDHYPVESIRDIDISPGLFADGPWDAKLVTVDGVELSLNDMEHRILRPIWKDPRVHYGVNCASIGCPNLQTFAFEGDKIDGMLEDTAIEYINHPRGARVEDGKLIVSSIYSWFEEDFSGEEGVLTHLRTYAGPELKESLAGIRSVDGDEYDWSLNDVAAYEAAVVGLVPPEGFTVPAAVALKQWEAHEPKATEKIDHAAWAAFLIKYVAPGEDAINRVDYGAVTKADRNALVAHIKGLEATPIRRYSRAEQFAYWVNLYNAAIVKLVLDHYWLGSILDIDGEGDLTTDSGPWDAKLVTVEGVKLSFNDIESRALRPIWKDPRIHYALSCAAYGCADLQLVPFTAANTEALLAKAAEVYVNHPRGARIRKGKLIVSAIYAWYLEDFGGNDESVLRHLRQYAKPAFKRELSEIERVAKVDYDWTLNDASRSPWSETKKRGSFTK